MAYPYYPNTQFYMQDLQNMRDKIDKQMQQMQQLNQNQMQPQQVPTNLTQNFQLAPNTSNNELESKYANNIDEVKNTFVMKTGVFVNKDFSTLWIKNTNGDIRIFQLNEIIEQDPKDIEIQNLRNEIERMKGMILNDKQSDNSNANVEITTKKSTGVQRNKSSNAK